MGCFFKFEQSTEVPSQKTFVQRHTFVQCHVKCDIIVQCSVRSSVQVQVSLSNVQASFYVLLLGEPIGLAWLMEKRYAKKGYLMYSGLFVLHWTFGRMFHLTPLVESIGSAPAEL